MKRFFILLLLMIATIAPQAKKETSTVNHHPWAGKKIGYIGDSITDPQQGGGNVTHYWQFLQDWLQGTAWVYGVSGHQWSQAPGLIDRLYKDHEQDVDGILIFLGTNDYNADLPLGKWFDEKPEQVERGRNGQDNHMDTRIHRTLTLDNNTLRGRINITMLKLKQLYPTKQIIVMTPIHRGYARFGNKNIQPDENYQNELGLYIDDYVEAIKETANVWAVPVIDLYSISGLNPMVKEQLQYFCNQETDQLHPNTDGHRRLAKCIMMQLQMYPPNWE